MKRVYFAFAVCLLIISCKKTDAPTTSPVIPGDTTSSVHITYRGADLSFLPEIEQAGTKFYDSTGEKPALSIFKEYGCNLVRVRLWCQPATEHSGLQEVLGFCKKVHDAGLQVFLDFHYSDTWADPSHQYVPGAWAALNIDGLKDSVKAYTQRVISLLKAQNTLPAIVQVGNEINAGMMWPAGKVSTFTDPNWPNFVALIKSGIEGIKAVDAGNNILIMLHYAGFDGAADFFTKMNLQNVQYDIAGVSYYPLWHGKNLDVVQQQLNGIASAVNKKVFIAETAYPFTLQWNDNTNNSVGDASQLIPAYPATPDGQLAFLQQLKTIVAAVPNNAGIGICYWAPDWVAFRGPNAINGSNAENLALFDFTNKALPGMRFYKK